MRSTPAAGRWVFPMVGGVGRNSDGEYLMAWSISTSNVVRAIYEDRSIVLRIVAPRHDGPIYDGDGNQIGELRIETKTPESERASWATAAARIARGSVGLTKAALGVDPAPDDVVKARLDVCDSCGHLTDNRRCGRLMSGGKTCGCWVDKKAKIAGEKCPLGKW